MIEIDRETFKNDEVWRQLWEFIKKHHKVARHTEETIKKFQEIEDFCEEARHFIIMPGKDPIYLHYDVATWFKEPNGVQVRIDSIGIYDDFMEYETTRVRELHSAKRSDIPNIN